MDTARSRKPPAQVEWLSHGGMPSAPLRATAIMESGRRWTTSSSGYWSRAPTMESLAFRKAPFAIFIGGFRPRDPALQFIFAHPIPRIKTFHVIGATDDLVRPERSQELLSTFQNAEVLHHPQGHVIPMDRAAQLGYLRFLQQGLLSAL
eukprot:GGOE01002542.1.p1 GENE.GGOE01002542.1~~GGOE01002542.1.p1  ORF type:complete len:149 (+),score=8.29 GGOE01002542.1:193-639(+)